MSSRILNWGVLGTSRVNKLVLPSLQASPRCRMVAIASRDAGRAQAAAQEWGIRRAYGSWDALLEDPEVEAIYVGLSNSYHVEWTLRALRAGKHVLCEKPLALAAADVDRIAEAARASRRVAAEALFHRYHPAAARVAEIVRSGALGRVRLIQTWFTISVQDETQSRLRPELGGGCLWDLGVYPISYLQLLAGDPESSCGFGTIGPSGVDEDYAGSMRFPGGVFGEFHCSFRMARRQGLEVVGTDATLTVPNPFRPGPADVLLLQRGAETQEITVQGAEPYRPQIENFVDAVLGGAPLAFTLDDSRRTIAVVENLVKQLHRSGTK